MSCLIYEPPFKLLQNTIQTVGTLTSPSFQVDRFTTIGLQINTSSASVDLDADAKIQVTLDGVNWGDYAGSTVAIAADGVTPYSISEYAFLLVRIVITVAVGTGTFEIIAAAKQS